MSKFNSAKNSPSTSSTSFIKTLPNTTTNHEGAVGVLRDKKSELFILAVTNFVSEKTFYEASEARDSRFVSLIHSVAVSDPDWISRFIYWMRNTANMRSASLVIALESAKALLDAKIPGGRALIPLAIARADEPAEAIAYWYLKYGRNIPKPIKRGIADAAVKVYSQRSLAKYDTASSPIRFADVIQITHPSPENYTQNQLFKYALDRRYNSQAEVPESLHILRSRANFFDLPKTHVRDLALSGELTEVLSNAGLSWENLSGSISGGMDAAAWEAVIPSMGYMALLRNLRNFQDAGVSRKTQDYVISRLSDPKEVEKSRQLPMRFLSAYKANNTSLTYLRAIEDGLNHSLRNIPSLSGRTLILVDMSGSMFWDYSERGTLKYSEVAALFGSALAVKAQYADLIQFGSSSKRVSFKPGDSLLTITNKFTDMGGTYTAQAVEKWFDNHDRIIILTDEQYYGSSRVPTSYVPDSTPVYTFNLAGYSTGHSEARNNRYTFGGLTDACFPLIELLERGKNGDWPF